MMTNKKNPLVERAGTQERGIDYFFLPDLCKVQPLFFLVLTAQLLVLVQTLMVSSLRSFDWLHFANTSFYVQWNVLLCAAALCWSRTHIQNMPRRLGAGFAWCLVLFVSVLISIVSQWLIQSSQPQNSYQGFDWGVNGSLVLTNLVIVGVMGGIALRYLYLQQQVQVQQQAQLQAHIQALQSRIRPHFLFNSMNIVASLIGSDPKKAERVIEDISELFRASLRAGDDLVSLEEEITLCKQYVSIEQLRLGERLRVDWQIDQGVCSTPMPSLTLQPLVENAIYHGIQPLAKGGVVTITAKLKNDHFKLCIQNPIPKPDLKERRSTPRGNQIALANTVARLQAHFGLESNVKTFVKEQCFFAEISYSVKK